MVSLHFNLEALIEFDGLISWYTKFCLSHITTLNLNVPIFGHCSVTEALLMYLFDLENFLECEIKSYTMRLGMLGYYWDLHPSEA